MTELKRPLPAFENPPVIETVLGVQFAPLESFTIPCFGLYWQRIRGRYPVQETQPALTRILEDFGTRLPVRPPLGIELVSQPEVRCWFIDASSTELIQVQRDRFIRNWRKVGDGDIYPRYERLKPQFEHDWAVFCAFLREFELGSPEVNQCEVTYINHFEIGRELDAYGEAHKVIRLLSSEARSEFLPGPEIVRINTTYMMADKKGRLHVELQPVIRRHDAREMLQLTLTARGRPASSRPKDVLEWFDMGHEWIVRGFTDLTTEAMHRLWRRTS